MSNKIYILSDQTINQIAAGEVIENPASVIKELVENAIDAGATRISIEVLSGGFQWIKISDNGSGMAPDDAAICLQRHTTSKIVNASDLFALKTMGFRGEALASISAISKMTLLTALENGPAVLLEIEGGKINDISPAARSRGTTIEVRSLFYNVPARKKFQKSASASSAEITKVVTQLSLAHPEIGFELIQQNQPQFCFSPGSGEPFMALLKARVAALLGKELLNFTYPLEMLEQNCRAKGLIADPFYSRRNRSGQYLFVNRRPVFCYAISSVVRDAYGTRLSTDRHPVYLLHLSMPSELLDVNVHPQKKEIRLREEHLLKHALHAAVNNALLANEEATFENIVPSALLPIHSLSFEPVSSGLATGDDLRQKFDFSAPLVFKEELTQPSFQKFELMSEINVIGLFRHYLLVDAESLPRPLLFDSPGIVWIDLLAVSSRLQFEAMMRSCETVSHLSQGLLIPLTLNYSKAEAQLLKAHLETLQKFGMQIREIGQTVFLIEAIPPFLKEEEVKMTLDQIIGELQGMERERSVQENKNRRLAICICKRVRAQKKSYHLSEATHLLKELLQADDPFHCPQGKKTLFYIKEEEIESYFTRKTAASNAAGAFAECFEKTKI
jgi:DNA mismatch repair protein MutL